MDPDVNLAKQLRIADRILESDESDRLGATELAELVIALNEWLSRGGFLPAAWRTHASKP